MEVECVHLLLQLFGLFHLSCFLRFSAHPRPCFLRRWNLLLSSITHSGKDGARWGDGNDFSLFILAKPLLQSTSGST